MVVGFGDHGGLKNEARNPRTLNRRVKLIAINKQTIELRVR